MSVEQHDQAAAARFAARRPQREAQLNQAGKGTLDLAEMERFDNRLEMLHPDDGSALERILGTSDLLEINFLEIGRRAARAVGRIQVRDRSGRVQNWGTGFLVSRHLLLTNNHVLPTAEDARRSLVDFDYEDDETYSPRPPVTFGIEPDRFFYSDSDLDFTLVALRGTATDGETNLSDYGFLPLIEKTGKVLLKEYVAIVQHPEGAPKKIALRNNQIIDLFDHYLHYTTDTDPGASGSPVLNDQWQVVALHHAGVKQRNETGQILSVDGAVWTPDMGEDRIAYAANEGVRVSSVVAHLQALAEGEKWNAAQRILLNELLDRQPTPRHIAGPVAEPVAIERDLEVFSQAKGYDPRFLGPRVPLPKLAPALLADVAPLLNGGGYVLKYVHFSLVMSRSRRIAYYTAVNVDGRAINRSLARRDVWYFDPRIDREHQSGPDLYKRNDLDRGHLVRRLDPVWGPLAATAQEDSFHFTNCAPQHGRFNKGIWNDLEDYVLVNAENEKMKVSVFTGPVLRADDMPYRGIYQLPAEFWKVVVMVKADRTLAATGFIQTQKNLLEDLEFAYGDAYKTYQVPVTRIEAITGLDFGKLRDYDPLSDVESASPARVIGGATDIRL